MLKQYKKTMILTSLLTLLPIPVGLMLWNQFPAQMTIHWGITGEANGWASIPVAVFLPPILMLITQWICTWFTTRDPGNRNRNRKIIRIVLWVIPILSNLCSYLMYFLAFGKEFDILFWTLAGMGLLFAVIGNYMPKTRMNATIGVKVPWAYTSEENWNATHRFAGRIWVIGGIAMVFCAFLPDGLAISVMYLSILVLTLVPTLYSWQYYKKQKAAGAELKSFSKADTAITKGSLIVLVVILLLVLYVLFAGKIDYQFREDSLLIDTNMYTDYALSYDAVTSVEYRDGDVGGTRVGGFGSFRLLMGYFRNEEFGTHIRYTYYKPEACIVVQTDSKTVVLSADSAAETRALYEALLTYAAQ